MRANAPFALASCAAGVLGVYLASASLPAGGAFLVDAPATLFWAAYAVPGVVAASLAALDESPPRLAVLSGFALVTAFLLMYAGTLTFMFFAPPRVYVVAYACALATGLPAAHRLRRECAPFAQPVLAASGAALGAALAYTGSGSSAQYAEFTGVFQALSTVPSILAYVGQGHRAVAAHRAALALCFVFSLVAAVVCSQKPVDSLLATMGLANTVAAAAAERGRSRGAVAKEPPEERPPLPLAGHTRGEALRREAAEAAEADAPRTRAQELVRFAASQEV